MKINSLVIFKNNPARVLSIHNQVIEVLLKSKKTFKVKDSSLLLLYEGKFEKFDILNQEINYKKFYLAWERVQGNNISYEKLAIMVYGKFNPSTAYAIWLQVKQGIYFKLKNSYLVANNKKEVEKILCNISYQNREKELLVNCITRLQKGFYSSEDCKFIREIVDYTLKKTKKCRILKLLGLRLSVNEAHSLLLNIKYWDIFKNPFIERYKIKKNFINVENYKIKILNKNRIDLTHLQSFAIDSQYTKDPDDAISFDFNSGMIWVHVSDPSSVIKVGGSLDMSLRERSLSMYLPDTTVPMLPKIIIDKFALGGGVSPALSIGFFVSDEGEILNPKICLSKIKVTRLTYEYLDKSIFLFKPLKKMNFFAKKFRKNRFNKGAIRLSLPEVSLKVQRNCVFVKSLFKTESRLMVQDIMIMAGVAIGKLSIKNNIPLPFFIQFDHGLNKHQQNPSKLSDIFSIKKHIKKSYYSIFPGKHSSMGVNNYVQVTSPLRRYLDLVVHQQLRKFINKETLISVEKISEYIFNIKSNMKNIKQCEIYSNKYWKCIFLVQNMSWKGEAVVVEEKNPSNAIIFIPSLCLLSKIKLAKPVVLDQIIIIKVLKVDVSEQNIIFRHIATL